MLVLLLALLSFSWLASEAAAQTPISLIPEQNGVLILNESTFAEAAHAYSPLFLLFDSPARYGSLTLARRFADAAQAVNGYNWNSNTKLRFASLDVTQLTRELPYELKVLGIPALVRFNCNPVVSIPLEVGNDPNEVVTPIVTCSNSVDGIEIYRGGRTSMEFQRYMLDQPLRDVIQVATRNELDALIATRQFVALFIVDGVDSRAFFDCRVLAQIDDDTSTYAATIDSNQQDLGHSLAVPSLVLYREFGKERIVYDGNWNKAALSLFIQKNRYNLVSTYTSTASSYFFDRAADGHVLLFSDPEQPYHNQLVDEVQDIARRYYAATSNPGKHVLRFVVIPKNEDVVKSAMAVPDDQYPTVLILRNTTLAPTRVAFFGADAVELLGKGTFGQALTDELEAVYAPFVTTDLPGEDSEDGDSSTDWRDYSDLFENSKQPVTTSSSAIPWSLAGTSGRSGRRLGEVSIGTSGENLLEPERFAFLSMFRVPPVRSVATPRVIDITSEEELLKIWRDGSALVVFYSLKCYSCRQAKGSIDHMLSSTPDMFTSARVSTIARVNLDQVDVRGWRLQFTRLPGIFFVAPPDRVAAFPSRTAPTSEALASFVQETFAHMSQIHS